ncbi:hypothetical protein Q7C36_009170 [Tachysurus vachellii]|uniref:Uncharacterized protein n=1 Tax=Tachysurus vachellii TaxID=175792 RepID=A0AA88N893_TACVA|nr:hypothetical protein Q7C36_009170 [Tachysurus vachellii]
MSKVRVLLFLLQHFVFSLLSARITKGHSTGRPDVPLTTEETSYGGGLHSVLQDSVSPAFGATIIIIITVIVSGSAYLCFLKYVCAGCCKPTQVAPVTNTNPNKSEEQV